MCGIFFALSRHGHVEIDTNTKQLLQDRGPDSTGQLQITLDTKRDNEQDEKALPSQLHMTFVSTVLALRGGTVVRQPLQDNATGSVFCWNGEAWSVQGRSVTGNDSEIIFDLLLKACAEPADPTALTTAVMDVLSSIKGPYAFTFYDPVNKRIYYGRDCLGRRSLLKQSTTRDMIVFSSVCDSAASNAWEEVEADGIYVFELQSESTTRTPHRVSRKGDDGKTSFHLPFPPLNTTVPSQPARPDATTVQRLAESLQCSLELRIQHVREAVQSTPREEEAKVAILFSGGLDCTILAKLSHHLLPARQSIDLLNVAFENPRVHKNLDASTSPYELCPDRITGRSSYAELQKTCPDRHWRFVAINVPYIETVAHRHNVMTLMYPHNTEMDLSIANALYFASRGAGLYGATSHSMPVSYTTSAHVLLSGLGADELFGGYQRHAVAFARRGYEGLIEELELDFSRLGKRNLGRDDRVISSSGKEVRFPYLDEDFIALALQLPVTAKCDFANPEVEGSDDPALLLEPGKRVLRMLAWELGMKGVAAEKKRAIQFGARTAKMETGRTKGTQVLS
ncbi:hypothetical protein P153DRAFT_396513 [Dothidotthia symphoricarpi CBS 119687]|uniref:Glutamine amidotransferase type-2 domain-containing protein n=1 Tax=Dothidotthia symphoricarpi CBS 119687 TaxID=1392245 RepID=A0A6A6AC96_9PLEO|nr:uncharacterized protein P153DRAFT_396513 [Dothidotthia symphoricarpi CBS 119687]KAF2129216.1 hypothetical protein P153DRAFT_396513 [Dothidotthia symphoricarpi CBS 119687]